MNKTTGNSFLPQNKVPNKMTKFHNLFQLCHCCNAVHRNFQAFLVENNLSHKPVT